MALRGKRILITGGSGFLGRALVKRLSQETGDIVVIGRGRQRPVMIEGARFLALDLTDEHAVEKQARLLQRCDIVVHLASAVPGRRLQGQQGFGRRDFLNNIQMSVNLLKHIQGGMLKQIVFASTAHVYSLQNEGRISESSPCRPRNLYAASKLVTELILERAFAKEVKKAILRFTQIYGPGEPHGLALGMFIDKARKGDSISLYNCGQDVRDLLYVDDAVEAILLAMQRGADGVYNIATGKGHSVREIVEMCMKVAGRDVKVKNVSINAPITKEVYDVSKARAELGFSPQVDLEEGIKKILAHQTGAD